MRQVWFLFAALVLFTRTYRFTLNCGFQPIDALVISFALILLGLQLATNVLLAFGCLTQTTLTVASGLLFLAAMLIPGANHRRPLKPTLRTMLILLLLLPIGTRLLSGFCTLPSDGDTIAYHLPNAIQMHKDASMFFSNLTFWFYPSNTEAIASTILTAGFNISSTNMISASALLIAMGCIVSIGRSLEHDMFTAVTTAVSFASMPIVWVYSVNTLNTDLPLCAYFALSLAASFALMRSTSGRQQFILTLIAASSCAVMIGSKYTGGPLALIAYVVLATQLFKRPNRTWLSSKQMIVLCLLCAVTFMGLGAIWYLRNAVISGCPAFPVKTFLDSDPAQMARYGSPPPDTSIASKGFNTRVLGLLWKALRRWGHWGFLVPSALLGAVFLLPAKYKKQPRTLPIRLIPWAFIATLLLFLTSPLVAENISGTLNQLQLGISVRFALPSLLLLNVLCAASLARLNHVSVKKACTATWLLLCLTSMRKGFVEVSTLDLFLFTSIGAGLICALVWLWHADRSSPLLESALLLPLCVASVLVLNQLQQRQEHWDAFYSSWYARNLGIDSRLISISDVLPAKCTIATNYSHILWLFGHGLTRHIVQFPPSTIEKVLSPSSSPTGPVYLLLQGNEPLSGTRLADVIPPNCTLITKDAHFLLLSYTPSSN